MKKVSKPSSLIKALVCSFFTLGFVSWGAEISGFVDAQVQYRNTATTAGDSGFDFRQPDGAIYFSHSMGGGKVFVDLPFAASGTDSMAFATGKTQAYLNWKYDFGLWWQLGQWDSIFGIEARDNIDNLFSTQGIVFGALPVTFTGILVGWDHQDLVGFKAFGANHDGTAARATGQNMDVGGQVWVKVSMVDIAAGLMMYKNPTTANSVMLIDGKIGLKVDQFKAEVGFVSYKGAEAGAESGMGVTGLMSFWPNKTWSLALRPEFASKMPAATTAGYVDARIYSRFQISAGPQYRINDHITTKLDYSFLSTTATNGATAVSSHGVNLAALYKF